MSKKKIAVDQSENLSHNPFAALGARFDVEATPDVETPAPEPAKPEQPMLMVRVEKRAKGKRATCVYHLAADHKAILKTLRQKLGAGGTVKDEVLELQGERREDVVKLLVEMGYRVRG